jgi:hypothetical protein
MAFRTDGLPNIKLVSEPMIKVAAAPIRTNHVNPMCGMAMGLLLGLYTEFRRLDGR